MKRILAFSIFALCILMHMRAQANQQLLGYKVVRASWENYEEGHVGSCMVLLDTAGTACAAIYFKGYMMNIPFFKAEEYTLEEDTIGKVKFYYGKMANGRYFVEKQIFEPHQGILLEHIPEAFFETVKKQLFALESVPEELLTDPMIERDYLTKKPKISQDSIQTQDNK